MELEAATLEARVYKVLDENNTEDESQNDKNDENSTTNRAAGGGGHKSKTLRTDAVRASE